MNTTLPHAIARLLKLYAYAVAALLTVFQAVAAEPVPFTPEHWDLKEATINEYLGRQSLAGTAWLKDVTFENGIIEVDLATDGRRSYPAIVFRRQADGEYEHVYFRPHRAGLYPDAVQYAPVFNGVAGWQLYSGPGFTAPLTLPENQWVHVRLEVKGTQARLFVGGATQPVLAIDELKRGSSGGTIGLQGPRDGSARFSNFSFTATDNLPFDPPSLAEPVPGVLSEWELSPVARAFDLAAERYLDGRTATEVPWTKVRSEPAGLVDVARHCKPAANGTSKIWARTFITSDQKQLRPFAFGYSDDISIYLNGQILFHGISGYQSRDPSFLGIVGWNDTVYLPLEKGTNELALSLSDEFGGWGFMVRDLNAIYRHESLQETWEIPGTLNAPESVIYDPARKVFYVSNFGADYISKIGLDGEILSLKWVVGVNKPTGLKMAGGKLFAVERSGIAVIDPENAGIADRRSIPDAGFVNDLAIDETGTIYVTDSDKNCIYKLSGTNVEVWLKGRAVKNPNGIAVEKGRLLVGVTADGALKSVDLATKQVTTFVALGAGANMDGLVTDGKGGYLFSDYYGRIYHADAAGRKTLLLDRRGPHQYCADFEFVPDKGLLVVPSLFDNRLTAYSCHLDMP